MENFTLIFVLASFFFGSVIGSFLNVVILRLPQGQSLSGRSRCLFCRHNLSAPDLFPLFSYLFLFGKCRYCGKRISPRYFIIEFITGILFAFSWWHVHPSQAAGYILLFKNFLIIATFIIVFIIDLEHYLILDSVIFPCLGVIILLNLILDFTGGNFALGLRSNFLAGLIAAIAAAAPFFLIWYFSSGRWMGFGDVKLALFLGAALGLPQVFVALLAAIMLGGIISAFLLLLTARTLKSRLPFGTFLSLGSVLSLFYGEKLLRWYLAFLGF